MTTLPGFDLAANTHRMMTLKSNSVDHFSDTKPAVKSDIYNVRLSSANCRKSPLVTVKREKALTVKRLLEGDRAESPIPNKMLLLTTSNHSDVCTAVPLPVLMRDPAVNTANHFISRSSLAQKTDELLRKLNVIPNGKTVQKSNTQVQDNITSESQGYSDVSRRINCTDTGSIFSKINITHETETATPSVTKMNNLSPSNCSDSGSGLNSRESVRMQLGLNISKRLAGHDQVSSIRTRSENAQNARQQLLRDFSLTSSALSTSCSLPCSVNYSLPAKTCLVPAGIINGQVIYILSPATGQQQMHGINASNPTTLNLSNIVGQTLVLPNVMGSNLNNSTPSSQSNHHAPNLLLSPPQRQVVPDSQMRNPGLMNSPSRSSESLVQSQKPAVQSLFNIPLPSRNPRVMILNNSLTVQSTAVNSSIQRHFVLSPSARPISFLSPQLQQPPAMLHTPKECYTTRFSINITSDHVTE